MLIYGRVDEDEDDSVYGYPEAPMFSPISPISPVLVPYPVMYPFVPSIQAFAFPTLPTGLPMAPPASIQAATTPKGMHRAKKSLTLITPTAQPVAMPQAYSSHRIVDGSTLLDREPPAGMYRPDGIWAARSVVRPLSTPPTPVHGPDVGMARVSYPRCTRGRIRSCSPTALRRGDAVRRLRASPPAPPRARHLSPRLPGPLIIQYLRRTVFVSNILFHSARTPQCDLRYFSHSCIAWHLLCGLRQTVSVFYVASSSLHRPSSVRTRKSVDIPYRI